MRVWTEAFPMNGNIPSEFAFGKYDPKTHVALSSNRNPDLRWEAVPAGTKSLALIFHDEDVPTRPDDVNQVGKTVPFDLPRCDFYHWVLIDLPPSTLSIKAGEYCQGVTPHGKKASKESQGREGLNDYTGWFKGDPKMEGLYFGYDGPCPPWNDQRVHHYHFTLYALDIARLEVSGNFDGKEALQAMKPHILEHSRWTGRYAIYPNAMIA